MIGIINAINRVVEKLGAMVISISGDSADYVCVVCRATGQVIGTGAWTKIQFNKKVQDPNNLFDTTNYRFIAPIAGYYQINASTGFTTNNATGIFRILQIYKNGANICTLGNGIPNATVPAYSAGGQIEYLQKGDYIEIFIYQDSGGNLTTISDPETRLSISKLNRFNTGGQNIVKTKTTKAWSNTVQAIVTGTFTKLTFDSESHDPENFHDNVTNNTRITVDESGYYMIGAVVGFQSNATGVRYVLIEKNAGAAINTAQILTDTRLLNCGAVNRTECNLATCAFLSKGDYVEVWAYQDSGGNVNVEKGIGITNFWVAKII